MFQRIIDFILNNLFIIGIVVVGLFNVSVRVAQKAKEQRQKRQAMLEVTRQKQEALRTGRVDSTTSVSQSNAPSAEDLRRQRIENMRRERVEQLRALREKRAGSTSSPSTPTMSPVAPSASPVGPATQAPPVFVHPTLPAIPVQSAPRRSPQARPQPRPSQRPTQTQSSSPNRRKLVASPNSSNRSSDPKRQSKKLPNSLIGSSSIEDTQIHRSTKRDLTPQSDAQSAVSMLQSRSSIRQAMILSEILAAPVGIRPNDNSLIY